MHVQWRASRYRTARRMRRMKAFEADMSRSKKPKREIATAGQSQRQLRVGELVRHAVASLLARGDVHDPVIEGHLITVPEVRMSPRSAALPPSIVMPLAGRDAEQVVAALDRNKKYMRGEVAHAVNLKFAPDLRFHIDNSVRGSRAHRQVVALAGSAPRSGKGRRVNDPDNDLLAPAEAPAAARPKARTEAKAGRRSSSSAATSATSMAGWCSTSRSA